ncbi:MAG: FAD:protein FMN transferase [Methylococcales bacterium]|nr:FAD:protein FMN transferase [Methylococcales bacterium]
MLTVFNFAFKAMGSPCHLQFYAASAQQANGVYAAVVARITQLEQRYSRYRADSLISRINGAAGTGVKTAIDAETFALLQYSEQCYQESEHLFDVTSGVLRGLWHGGQTQLPTTADIHALLPRIGWEKVQWSRADIYLPLVGMELDFGGIVKEYAADVAASLCQQHGIHSGIIELGGDVRIIGPMPNGRGWPVAIRDPRHPTKTVAQFELKSGALASSGDYERFQLIDGVRYGHILNPKTGWPVAGLRAVSIVADQCVVAGSLATIAMLKANAGLGWLQTLHVAFLCCKNNGQLINSLKMGVK